MKSKKILTAGVSVLTLLALVGCGSNTPDKKSEDPGTTSGEVVTTKYLVNVTTSADYTIAGIDAQGYAEGATVTFTITVTNANKELKAVSVAGQTIPQGADGSYSFTMPGRDVQIVVTLGDKVVDKFDLTYSGDLKTGAKLTFTLKKNGTALPSSAYTLEASVGADLVTISGNEVTLNAAGDVTIVAKVEGEAKAQVQLTVAQGADAEMITKSSESDVTLDADSFGFVMENKEKTLKIINANSTNAYQTGYFANSARIYKNTDNVIKFNGLMSKLVITSDTYEYNGTTYKLTTETFTSSAAVTTAISGDNDEIMTLSFASPVSSVSFKASVKQIRLASIEVVASSEQAPALQSISIDNAITLDEGANEQLTINLTPANAVDYDLTFTSSTANAKVSSLGVVTGVSQGSAVVKASIGTVVSNECAVTVNKLEIQRISAIIADAQKDDLVVFYGIYNKHYAKNQYQGIFVDDGAYSMMLYKYQSSVPATWKSGETILKISGTYSPYNGLPEVVSPTIEVVSDKTATELGIEAPAAAKLFTSVTPSATTLNTKVFVEFTATTAGSFSGSSDLTYKAKVGETEVAIFFKKSTDAPAEIVAGKTYRIEGVLGQYVKSGTATYQLVCPTVTEIAA